MEKNLFKKAKIVEGGNIKLGGSVGTWSKLKGNDPVYVQAIGSSVYGSCGKYCDGCTGACYVNASYRYGSVIYGHAIRTLAMRDDIESLEKQLSEQFERKKRPFKIIRINQSGELESTRELAMWVNLAKKQPGTDFYLYTKAFDIALPYLKSHELPSNITVLISVWHEYGVAEYNELKHIPNIKAFVYMDGFDYEAVGLKIGTKCNAYQGKKPNHEITCDKCRKCFDRIDGHKVVGCDAH